MIFRHLHNMSLPVRYEGRLQIMSIAIYRRPKSIKTETVIKYLRIYGYVKKGQEIY